MSTQETKAVNSAFRWQVVAVVMAFVALAATKIIVDSFGVARPALFYVDLASSGLAGALVAIVVPAIISLFARPNWALITIIGMWCVFGLMLLGTRPGQNGAVVATEIVDPFAQSDIVWRAFVQTRCELRTTTPTSRPQVDDNMAILRQAMIDVFRPGMTYAQQLQAAGERVYAYPSYTPRGYCPD